MSHLERQMVGVGGIALSAGGYLKATQTGYSCLAVARFTPAVGFEYLARIAQCFHLLHPG